LNRDTLQSRLPRVLEDACSDESWLAKRIDHAVLNPSARERELLNAVEELERHNLRCLITSPTLLKRAKQATRRCVGAVAGFPFGYSPLEAKIKEVEELIGDGADEIDYVANTQRLLLGQKDKYLNELRAVTTICRETGIKCKIIIETPLLSTRDLIEEATRLAASTTPDYLKTSTGYAPRPTYPEDVVIMRRVLREEGRHTVGIKAAGGIRTSMQALTLIAAGADIIGTSKPGAILATLREICADGASAGEGRG